MLADFLERTQSTPPPIWQLICRNRRFFGFAVSGSWIWKKRKTVEGYYVYINLITSWCYDLIWCMYGRGILALVFRLYKHFTIYEEPSCNPRIYTCRCRNTRPKRS
jgi:hypothetical protein